MTSARQTCTLLLLATALFAYIALFEWHQPDADTRAVGARRLFPELQPARVTALTLTLTNASVRAERRAGQWQLADPPYPAQGRLIDAWLESVAGLNRRAHLSAQELLGEPGGMAALGLQPARATVTLEQEGERIQFRFGARTAFGEKIYLQRVGAEGVEITEALALAQLPRGPADWREPRFLQLGGLRFDRLQMRAAAREYEVQRDPTQRVWRLTRPRAARADQGRVDQLLQQLQAVEVAQFVQDFPTADLERFGLQPPEAVLTFLDHTNPVLVVEFGSSPTNAPSWIHARRSQPGGIVAVPREVLELAAVPATELLDFRLIDLPLETVDQVEVRAEEAFALRRQTNGTWRVTGPAEFPADPALVAGFLQHLQSLRMTDVAKELVTELELPRFGLAPPLRSYALHAPAPGGTNARPATLRLDLGSNQVDQVFARRSDENPIYLVRRADCAALPTAAYEFRDRRLWNFATNDVTGVTVSLQGVSCKLLRNPGGRWSFAPGSQGMLNTFALEEAVHRMGSLRAVFWAGEGAAALDRHGFAAVQHRLSLELNLGGQATTLTLDFGATSPSGGPFAACTLDGRPVVFEFPLDIYHPYQEAIRALAPSRPNP